METGHGLRLFGTGIAKAPETESPWPTQPRHRSTRPWERVRRNRGSAGVDAQSIADVERLGIEGFLMELQAELRAGKYRPRAVLRRYIPKADGRKRPLGIPTVRDRVVQAAARIVLEPIFEADFCPSSWGFRPKRSATGALEALRVEAAHGGNHVLDADIRDYLDRCSHYTSSDGVASKRGIGVSNTLMRKPLRRPRLTWSAWSSPRFTRCNTV